MYSKSARSADSESVTVEPIAADVIAIAASRFKVTSPVVPPPFKFVPAVTAVMSPAEVIYPASFVHCRLEPLLLVNV